MCNGWRGNSLRRIRPCRENNVTGRVAAQIRSPSTSIFGGCATNATIVEAGATSQDTEHPAPPMTNQQDEEITVLEVASVSVARLGDLSDKLVLTVWANGAQRFIVDRRMATFLGKAIEDAVEKLSLRPHEHRG